MIVFGILLSVYWGSILFISWAKSNKKMSLKSINLTPINGEIICELLQIRSTKYIFCSDLGFINPRYWPMLWNLPLGNASFVNVGIQTYNYEQAVVHTTNRQTMLFASPPNLYGTGKSMMTSSNGNIFRVTGHLCGEFTGHRWIPRTKACDVELWCFLWSAPQ